MTTREEIRQYIVENWLSGDARGFADDTDLQQNGILDSFTTLALIGFLESRWGIQLDPGDINAEAFRSVDALEQVVHSKLGQRNG
jgi:acyl carrier protein